MTDRLQPYLQSLFFSWTAEPTGSMPAIGEWLSVDAASRRIRATIEALAPVRRPEGVVEQRRDAAPTQSSYALLSFFRTQPLSQSPLKQLTKIFRIFRQRSGRVRSVSSCGTFRAAPGSKNEAAGERNGARAFRRPSSHSLRRNVSVEPKKGHGSESLGAS
jgi:hypothetical protein